MGQNREQGQIAFMGNPADLVDLLAAQLTPLLLSQTKIEEPMDLKAAAVWLGCSTRHLEGLVATAQIPYRDFATPGSSTRMLRFWKHELAMWQGTAGMESEAERRVNEENKKRLIKKHQTS